MRKELLEGLLLASLVSPAAASADSVTTLRWMAGCWSAVGQPPGSGEQWMSPAGGSMLGMSRTVRGARTVAFEFVRIIENDAGEIEFIASPSGQPTATFKAVKVADNEVIFESAGHDFPQRVIYRRLPEGGLLGRIEGTMDGEWRGVDFPMQKSVCGSS